MESTDSKNRFVATLVLPSPSDVATNSLVKKIQELFPILERRVTSLGSDARKPGSNLLKIDETILTVIPVAMSAPPGSFERALRTEKMWPEARQEFARHKAITIISTLNTFSGAANCRLGFG
jgi:hypothetical protein